MKELIKQNWSYTLFETDNRFILKVLCGTIGLYEIMIELNNLEIKLYEEKGKSFIEELALKIQTNPSSYKKRFITLSDK